LDGVRSKDVVPAVTAVTPLVVVPCEDFRSRAKAIRDGQNKLIVGDSDPEITGGHKRGAHIFQFSWAMGAAFPGLTVPDLSLGDAWGTKITTTVVDGGIEGPRSLERRNRTGGALSRDKARKEGGNDGDCSDRAHFHWQWSTTRSAQRGYLVNNSGENSLGIDIEHRSFGLEGAHGVNRERVSGRRILDRRLDGISGSQICICTAAHAEIGASRVSSGRFCEPGKQKHRPNVPHSSVYGVNTQRRNYTYTSYATLADVHAYW